MREKREGDGGAATSVEPLHEPPRGRTKRPKGGHHKGEQAHAGGKHAIIIMRRALLGMMTGEAVPIGAKGEGGRRGSIKRADLDDEVGARPVEALNDNVRSVGQGVGRDELSHLAAGRTALR